MPHSFRRVKAIVAYDGSAYFGFQKQTSTSKTITADIEKALHSLHINTSIVGSGRTDAGVHATGQVIHFDIPEYWHDLKKLKLNLNRKLTSIRFKHITFVPSDFHARFGAKKRIYRYIFKTKESTLFEQKYISHYAPFDATLLTEALTAFEGKYDFDFFRKTGTVTHTSIREIYSATYKQYGDYHIIYFQANGFLRSQVRMMVDAAMRCAKEELTLNDIKEQLHCHKKHTTKLAPAEGLYLAKIIY
jgi:tRNA pseudouridine38-40 synthase